MPDEKIKASGLHQEIYEHGGSRLWTDESDGTRNLIVDTYMTADYAKAIKGFTEKWLSAQANGAEIGTVFADNIVDPESLDSIRFGMIKGEGLLGAALEAGLKLAELEGEAGYWGENITKEMSEALKQQRVVFYNSLKAIERLES